MSRSVDETTIEQFKTCLAERDVNVQTADFYLSNVRKLSEYLGGRELTQSVLESYKKWLLQEKKYKKNSANTYIACVRVFIQTMGWEDMDIQIYSMAGERGRRGGKHISRADYRQLVETAIRLGDYRTAMMVQVLCHADLRFSEFPLLDREAVERGYVEAVRHKHAVRVVLPDYLAESLKAYADREGITSGVVFRAGGADGKSVPDRTGVWRKVKKLCAKAGLEEGTVTLQKLKKPDVEDYYPFYPVV